MQSSYDRLKLSISLTIPSRLSWMTPESCLLNPCLWSYSLLAQSALTLLTTCPNHCHQVLSITKLTDSSLNIFAFLFLSFSLKPCLSKHNYIAYSLSAIDAFLLLPSNFVPCSFFICQVSCHMSDRASCSYKKKQRGLRGLLCRWPSITEWEMYITAQGCRFRNDLYCVEWDVKLYYTIQCLMQLVYTLPFYFDEYSRVLMSDGWRATMPLRCNQEPLVSKTRIEGPETGPGDPLLVYMWRQCTVRRSSSEKLHRHHHWFA